VTVCLIYEKDLIFARILNEGRHFDNSSGARRRLRSQVCTRRLTALVGPLD
jgi:hypothetical protein